MGLRLASVRLLNVVMAPALTETVQSQSFKFATSPSQTPSLSLKNHKKKAEIICEEIIPKLANGVSFSAGMNGHSPANNKTTYSINGLAKNLKNEFLSLNIRKDDDKKTDTNYPITQVDGYMMNSGFIEDSEMGLRKSNEGEKVSQEVDQFFKNLTAMNNDELSTNPELNQNVDDILKVISNLDSNTNDVSGPSVEGEPIFSDIGTLSNFDRDLFNDVDVMNMCVDDTLVTINKEALIADRIDEFRKRKFLLRRKIEFLVRRLKKVKSHLLGKHASEEITGALEYSSNLLDASSRFKVYPSDVDLNLKFDVKSVSYNGMSLFMRQMDHAVNQQTNTIARNSIRQCKYFGSGSSSNSIISTSNGVRSTLPGSILPSYPSEAKEELNLTFGELHYQLKKLQEDVDSDVTESSSGCESCDEFVNYNNALQHTLSIGKRARWKWAEERSQIASKWTWLHSQISDLDYRIRQHNDIRRNFRGTKGSVKLEEAVERNLPNGCKEGSDERGSSCVRTRGLVPGSFNKRRIVTLNGLHRNSLKAAKNFGIRCSCIESTPGCGLCTGRTEQLQLPQPVSTLPVSNGLSTLDPGFHPVLSFPRDVSATLHYNAVMKCTDWQTRASRIQGSKISIQPVEEKPRGGRQPAEQRVNNEQIAEAQRSKAAALAVSLKLRRKIVRGRRKKRNPAMNLEQYRQRRKQMAGLNAVDNEEDMDQDYDVSFNQNSSPTQSPAPQQTHGTMSTSKDKETMKRKRENSYDIDNIVIPYSMAASTRPEILNYKEILTPKWRKIGKVERDVKNGIRRSSHEVEGTTPPEVEEDFNDEIVVGRHDRCEVDEKKKFLSYLKLPNSGIGRGRGGQRRLDSSGPSTPDGMSPRDDQNATVEESIGSPPPTPSEVEPSRKRTTSSSQQILLPEISPYDQRIYPLNDDTYRNMIDESRENQHYPVTNSTYEEPESTSGLKSPGSVSTDSADSFVGEDPNDPEWTSVDRSNSKR